MNMLNWYKKVVFENYANFTGRATRSEFWYFALCNFIISIIFYIPIIAMVIISGEDSEPPVLFWIFYGLFLLYGLATLLPNLAVTARRLHDIGKSGWTFLVYFIPLVGPILLLVFLASDGQPHPNKWGSDPKALPDEINEIGKSS